MRNDIFESFLYTPLVYMRIYNKRKEIPMCTVIRIAYVTHCMHAL